MRARFGVMAAAFNAAGGPGAGVSAFIGWCLATAMIKFALIESDGSTRWMKETGDDTWEDTWGNIWRRQNYPDIKVKERAYADGFDKLDWRKTSFYNAKGTSGWLDPAGVFWGCDYGGHSKLTIFVIRREYVDIEREGWVHVNDHGRKGKYSYRVSGILTPAQEVWLVANGHDLDPSGEKARRKQADTITLAGVVIDKKADKAAFEDMMARAPKRAIRSY